MLTHLTLQLLIAVVVAALALRPEPALLRE